MTILQFPSIPIGGGTLDLSNNNNNFSVTQLTPNKFLAVYRQNNPNYVLAQVINIIDKDTVTFGNIWVINTIQFVGSLVVRKISGTNNKALLLTFQNPTSNSLISIVNGQILTVDNNDDISASSIKTDTSYTSPILPAQLCTCDVVPNKMIFFYFTNLSPPGRYAIITIDTSTDTIIFGNKYTVFSSPSSNYFNYIIEQKINDNREVFVLGYDLGINSSGFIRKITFDTNLINITNTQTLANNLPVNTTATSETYYTLGLANMANNYIYFVSKRIASDPFYNSSTLYEINLNTGIYNAFDHASTKHNVITMEKIDDYHLLIFPLSVSNNPIGTNMKVNVLRPLFPGLLESPLNPITIAPSQTGEFRNNIISSGNYVSSYPASKFNCVYDMNKNIFKINSNLFCYFYKTSLGFRVALVHD